MGSPRQWRDGLILFVLTSGGGRGSGFAEGYEGAIILAAPDRRSGAPKEAHHTGWVATGGAGLHELAYLVVAQSLVGVNSRRVLGVDGQDNGIAVGEQLLGHGARRGRCVAVTPKCRVSEDVAHHGNTLCTRYDV